MGVKDSDILVKGSIGDVQKLVPRAPGAKQFAVKQAESEHLMLERVRPPPKAEAVGT